MKVDLKVPSAISGSIESVRSEGPHSNRAFSLQ